MAAKRIKIDNASSKFRRQSQKREQKVIRCSVLIVCEGTKTEPNYFEAFAEKQQGVIVYDIEVKGLGRGTKDVVEKAIDLKNKNNYDVSIRPRACFFPLFSFLPLWLHYNLNPLCVQY